MYICVSTTYTHSNNINFSVQVSPSTKLFPAPSHLLLCACCYFSHVWLFVTPRTIAHQAPLCKGFSRQEYWSGLPCPPPGDLPNLGVKSTSLMSPALAGRFFTTTAIPLYWEPKILYYTYTNKSWQVCFAKQNRFAHTWNDSWYVIRKLFNSTILKAFNLFSCIFKFNTLCPTWF